MVEANLDYAWPCLAADCKTNACSFGLFSDLLCSHVLHLLWRRSCTVSLVVERERGVAVSVDIVCWRVESLQVTDVFDEKSCLVGM